MVKDIELKGILDKLNYFVIKADENHLFLYDKRFWRYHFKAWKLIFLYNRSKPKMKLRQIPLFIWLKYIPFYFILWFLLFFTILIVLDLNGSDNSLFFLINFPHTIFLFGLFHKIFNYSISRYYKKIQYDIDVLTHRRKK